MARFKTSHLDRLQMKKYLLLVLWLCIGCGETRMDTIPKLKLIVTEIAIGNSVESSKFGEGGSPSKQWEKYEQLKKSASTEQLIMLTDHKNEAVRCYAFRALTNKNSDKVYPILLNHLHDTSTVFTLTGGHRGREYVGDYFIKTANYFQMDLSKYNDKERKALDSLIMYHSESKTKLTVNQRKTIDSILLNDKSIILLGSKRLWNTPLY